MSTINPLDEAALHAAAETGAIVTVEEASVRGGLGGAVAEFTAANQPVPVERVGFPGFLPTGSVDWLFEEYGLTARRHRRRRPPRPGPQGMSMRVLAIDQGTTNTKAVLIDESGAILARASAPLTTSYPHPGWAEQSAADIWASVQAVIAADRRDPRTRPTPSPSPTSAKRWCSGTASTRQPICPAPIWQCRRTADDCAALIAAGHDPRSSPPPALASTRCSRPRKLAWVLRNVPAASDLLHPGPPARRHGRQLAPVEPDRRRHLCHRPFQRQPHPAVRHPHA